MNADRTYPAKLLLFGEYTVLNGSRALAMPLNTWKAQWVNQHGLSNNHLKAFADFIEKQHLLSNDATVAFKSALTDGIALDSDIPQGFGVGSSGALCAAVFDAFDDRKNDHLSISDIREILAGMESYFHGKSSGMDPLVSLQNAPVLHEFGTYAVLPDKLIFSPLRVFLIDSGSGRKTDHLVSIYLQKCADEAFQISCLRPLIQSVDHAISFIIDLHLPMLLAHLKLISHLQFQYFREMIPEPVRTIWSETLDQNEVTIKLCGAGGGGFFLGFATSEDVLNRFTRKCPLRTIPLNPD